MTKSYANSLVRKYRHDHPWTRRVPKDLIPKKDRPIDLGVLDINGIMSDYDPSLATEIKNVGDGSWAIVYDESRIGEWLFEPADNGWANHICSECRYTVNTDWHVGLGDEYNRCPRCGADMRAEHGVKYTDTEIIVH